jgi:BASS family bile acid:Na+ symporter
MRLIASVDALFGFLGAHATRVLFVGIFLGLAAPPLAALVRPALTPSVLIMMSALFLRIDWSKMAEYARRPVLATLLTAWLIVGAPIMMWLVLEPVNPPDSLGTALVLMAAAPPILTSAAIAVLLGLDGALAIVTGLAATLLVPFTLPPLALLLLGLELQIGTVAFSLRLAAIVLPAFAAAALVRKFAGTRRVSGYAKQIDGIVVVAMLVFAIGVMDGVTDTLIARPGVVVLWTLAAFIANPCLQLLGILAFSWLGRKGALTVGLLSGNCNMGLLLATMPAKSEFDVLLFFAVGQFPIFMLPAILLPIYRRFLAQAR